jgi:hypothetical protein
MLRFASLPGLLAALLVVFGLTSPARGSILQALDLDELVEQSDQILLGRVVFSESFVRPNGTLGTWHRIEVERDLRRTAASEREVIVETLGGRVGDLGMRVEGEPSFSVGERVVVFAHGGGPYTAARPVGMGQGVLRVRNDDGSETVRQSREGMMLMRRNAQGRLEKSLGAVPTEERLESFISRVRTIVERKAGGAGE